MKAHRWYSAFRNVGVWALGVVVAWAVISSWIDYPERHSVLSLMSLIGPLFIVRYGNHSNEVGIWFHQRWDKPMNIGSGAREVSPNIVFSSTIFPDCSGKVDPTRSKR